MPSERYFLNAAFSIDDEVSIEDLEFHHLVHVMRNKVNEEIELVNGRGQIAEARIIAIDKKRAKLLVLHVFQEQDKCTPLILAQGIPRLAKLETILEKATELGATEIWLFPAEGSDKKKFTENQLLRLHAILISALKQCGRLFLPKLIFMPPLEKWHQIPFLTFFGDTCPTAPLFLDVCQKNSPKKGSIFCIGPETGFFPTEIAALKKLGAIGVKLHWNILRTETAAISALNLLSQVILATPL